MAVFATPTAANAKIKVSRSIGLTPAISGLFWNRQQLTLYSFLDFAGICSETMYPPLPCCQTTDRPFPGRFHYWFPAPQVTIYRQRLNDPPQ